MAHNMTSSHLRIPQWHSFWFPFKPIKQGSPPPSRKKGTLFFGAGPGLLLALRTHRPLLGSKQQAEPTEVGVSESQSEPGEFEGEGQSQGQMGVHVRSFNSGSMGTELLFAPGVDYDPL